MYTPKLFNPEEAVERKQTNYIKASLIRFALDVIVREKKLTPGTKEYSRWWCWDAPKDIQERIVSEWNTAVDRSYVRQILKRDAEIARGRNQ